MFRDTYITIASQDTTYSKKLFTPDEALYFYPASASLSSQRFSILGLIPTFRRPREVYEFILEYPELNDSIIWEQNYSPIDINETNVPGHENSKPYNYTILHNNYRHFHGLMLSASNSSFLDGYDLELTSWPYAICTFSLWGNGIPGPFLNQTITVNKYNLLMRVILELHPSCKIKFSLKSSCLFSIFLGLTK